ncbi:hypothetical protein MCHI_002559, partial [Candidatus Magnetoovum chiemensis]
VIVVFVVFAEYLFELVEEIERRGFKYGIFQAQQLDISIYKLVHFSIDDGTMNIALQYRIFEEVYTQAVNRSFQFALYFDIVANDYAFYNTGRGNVDGLFAVQHAAEIAIECNVVLGIKHT